MAELLTGADRQRLRRFAATQALQRPRLLPCGKQIADELRKILPTLEDDTIAAVTASISQVATHHAQLTGCPHVRSVALLLNAAVVDLAHLELDPPDPP